MPDIDQFSPPSTNRSLDCLAPRGHHTVRGDSILEREEIVKTLEKISQVERVKNSEITANSRLYTVTGSWGWNETNSNIPLETKPLRHHESTGPGSGCGTEETHPRLEGLVA